MKKGNFVVASLSLILGIAIIGISLTFPEGTNGVPGPGLFPILISAVLMVSAVILIIRTIKMPEEENVPLDMLSSDKKRVYLTMLVLVIYFIVLPYIGFCVSSFAMLCILIKWFSKKSILKCIIISAAMTAVVYFLFRIVLSVPLDFGLLI